MVLSLMGALTVALGQWVRSVYRPSPGQVCGQQANRLGTSPIIKVRKALFCKNSTLVYFYPCLLLLLLLFLLPSSCCGGLELCCISVPALSPLIKSPP